jgi:predicted DNA-binding transcriptional regulator YafY
MLISEILNRQRLIVQKLQNNNKATFQDIVDFLQRESAFSGYNYTLSKRTFHRDVEDIYTIFGIEIKCGENNRYYIENDAAFEVNNRIFEAFDVLNAISLAERVSPYLQLEKAQEQGSGHLKILLQAIKNSKSVKFYYVRFMSEGEHFVTANPLCLKEYRRRWYLVAEEKESGIIKKYALDRVSKIEILGKFKKSKSFDPDKLFEHSFGIIAPDIYRENIKPEKVVLSLSHLNGQYIKSLPLHSSQQILIDNSEELRISLTLYITHDFVIELLSMGEHCKVISPQSLADTVKNTLQKALKQYD